VATLFCEAKCTADHDVGMISKAHEKSSLANLVPVDALHLIEVLEDSSSPEAGKWVNALRQLWFRKQNPGSGYERVDQITYVCGRAPVKNGNSWIPANKPHQKYTGGRRLHVAEIQLSNVESLIKKTYGV